MGTPRVTIIILNWNGKHHLQECLDSVFAQDLGEPFDVMVWDNGSTDGSQRFVVDRFPRVHLVDGGENVGFAKAMNRAIGMVETEHVVLLNNDTKAEPGWLKELVRVADASPPDVASVGSRMVFYDRPDIVNHAGALFSPFGGAFDEGLGRPVSDFTHRPDVYETGASSGGAALYRRKLFQDLGGFDERFFLYFEDADFCRRAWLSGYRILHSAKAVVRHKMGATTGDLLSPLRLREGQKNRLLMLHQCSPTGLVTPRILLNIGWTKAAGLYLLVRHPRAAKAWISGAWKGWRGVLRARPRRRAVQARRQRSETELRKRGLVATYRTAIRESNRLRRSLER